MTANQCPGLVIRPIIENDVESVARLSRELGAGAESDEITQRISGILTESGQQVLVAESPKGEVVGWVHVFSAPRVQSEPFAELGGLVVAETERRNGIGGQLVAAAEGWAHSNGCQVLRIRSRLERSAAHCFLESSGFRRVKSQHVFERPRSPENP
jgi:GNAT superfamily N-acetyltransferase